VRAIQNNTLALSLISVGPLLLTSANPASSQTPVTVTVNAGGSLGAIPPAAFGLNTAVWDGHLRDPGIPGLLTGAGITALRFPGGSTSDVYHWRTQTTDGGDAYPFNTFDAFMGIAKKIGAVPIITVNYGSNADGTGGGDPNEAAAWVDYSNNTRKYGVKYWEIGNEIYGNGEYGAKWEKDLHAAHDPTTYGNNVVTFANAMKAKDPTIDVGVVLTTPDNWPDKQTPNWNTGVLAACGTKIDFVIVHWYANGSGNESDSGLLSSTGNLGAKVSAVRSLIAQYCGSNAPNVQIFLTESNSAAFNPGKQTVSLVNALFAADDYMTWLENGVANVDWWGLHNGANTSGNNSSKLYGSAAYGDYGVLSSASNGEPPADAPFPSYYGIQMLNDLGHPGDTMVLSSSSTSLLRVHAIKRTDGSVSILLLNDDPSNSDTVTVSVNGPKLSTKGTRYDFGPSQVTAPASAANAPTKSRISHVGNRFTITVPAYTESVVIIPHS